MLRPASLILIAAQTANLAIALWSPNIVSSVIATCLFVFVLLRMFRNDLVSTWLVLPVAITQLSVMVSLNVIEGGAYMVEMGQAGRASPAAALFGCYSLLFLFCSTSVFRGSNPFKERAAWASTSNDLEVDRLFQWAILLFGIFCFLYLAIAGLRTGFPLLKGIDRFEFRRAYADIVTVNILDLKTIPLTVLGAVAAVSTQSVVRISSYGVALGVLAISFLYADKFFIILISTIAMILPSVVIRPESAKRILKKLAPIIGVTVILSVAVTYFLYSDYGSKSVDATLYRILDRIAGQGELWFLAVKHAPGWINYDAKVVSQNIASLFAPIPQDYVFDHHLSVLYFVFHYSPPAMFRSFQHNAGFVTPTMGYEAYGLVLFGYLGLFMQMALSGVLMGWLMSYLYRMILGKNIFAILLPAFLLNQATKFLSQGTLYSLLSISVFKAYLAFGVLQFLTSILLKGFTAGPTDRKPNLWKNTVRGNN